MDGLTIQARGRPPKPSRFHQQRIVNDADDRLVRAGVGAFLQGDGDAGVRNAIGKIHGAINRIYHPAQSLSRAGIAFFSSREIFGNLARSSFSITFWQRTSSSSLMSCEVLALTFLGWRRFKRINLPAAAAARMETASASLPILIVSSSHQLAKLGIVPTRAEVLRRGAQVQISYEYAGMRLVAMT